MLDLSPPPLLIPKPAIIRPATKELLKYGNPALASFLPGMFPSGPVTQAKAVQYRYVNTYNSVNSPANPTFSLASCDLGPVAAGRVVVVGAHCGGSATGVTLSSATIDGSAATVPAGSNIVATSSQLVVAMFYLQTHANAAGTIALTFGGNKERLRIWIWALYDVNPTHTDEDEAQSASSGTTISLSSLTIPTRGVGMAVVGHGPGSTTDWAITGAAEESGADLSPDPVGGSTYRGTAASTQTAGTNTITGTTTASVSLRAAAGLAFGPVS